MTDLNRSISLFSASLYGIGTIVGAGIYVLIGTVINETGYYAPVSFLLAGVITGCTGMSYAELSSRYPQTAGSALYIDKAWNNHRLTQLATYTIAFTGIVSAATIANGLFSYITFFFDVSRELTSILLVCLLAAIACIGIKLSVFFIGTITILEVGGLLSISFIAFNGPPSSLSFDQVQLPNHLDLNSIALGIILAFYAFIGFEDMVNMAEEVKNPKRTLPKAIVYSVVFCTLLYVLVCIALLYALELETIRATVAPLVHIVTAAGYPAISISIIAIFAVVNGALVQILMASRLLLGAAKMGKLPMFFAVINTKTKTPINSTLFVAALILLFALLLPIKTLASLTSYVVLTLFVIVNASLIKIKKSGIEDQEAVSYTILYPIIGLVLSVALLIYQLVSALLQL